MKLTKTFLIVPTLLASLGAAACGRSDLGRSPSQVVIETLEGASGAEPDKFGSFVNSDVVTNVKRTVDGKEIQIPTVFNDVGRVKLRLVLRDQGTTGSPAVASAVNAVTFTHLRIEYQRTDGLGRPGVDVPYSWDTAMTLTVPAGGDATGAFEIVKHTSKGEAPLSGLVNSPTIISTIANITFFGKDLAGNDVVAKGSIAVFFGNFGDPQQ
ncbi:MAG: hypothetical protein ABL986_12610 [Vicinamibacterales bacterium]